jgi:hypothetical protein
MSENINEASIGDLSPQNGEIFIFAKRHH